MCDALILIKRYYSKFARTVPLDTVYHKMVAYENTSGFAFCSILELKPFRRLFQRCEVSMFQNMPEEPHSEYMLELLQTKPPTIQR